MSIDFLLISNASRIILFLGNGNSKIIIITTLISNTYCLFIQGSVNSNKGSTFSKRFGKKIRKANLLEKYK